MRLNVNPKNDQGVAEVGEDSLDSGDLERHLRYISSFTSSVNRSAGVLKSNVPFKVIP
jgi:hypothetical protein